MKSAFTLIELMISIAIGSLILYVAMAGLRTVAQSVASAQRLAIENHIIRSGVDIALQNTDYWLDRDNPQPSEPALEQSLRGIVADPKGKPLGLPFTPFADAKAVIGYGPVNPTNSTPDPVKAGQDEAPGGWNPNAWNACEERGWTWVNMIERTPKWKKANQPDTAFPVHAFRQFGNYDWIASPDPTHSRHHWQQRQLAGLYQSIGPYGMMDYIPANVGLAIYEKSTYPQSVDEWMISATWCCPNLNVFFSMQTDANWNYMHDRQFVTWGKVFSMPMMDAANKPPVNNIFNGLDNRAVINYRNYPTGIRIPASGNQNAVDGVEELTADAENYELILHTALPGTVDSKGVYADVANKPDAWPSLHVATLRFIRTGAYINLNRIIWADPLTGRQAQLSFTCFGTSLRGARQQRLRDEPGWVDPFPATGIPKPNLDDY